MFWRGWGRGGGVVGVSYISGEREKQREIETERKRRVDKTPSQPAYISAIERGTSG